MRRKHFLIPAFLVLVSLVSPANAAPAPETVLSEILESDFKGDPSPRIGKAIFTDGKGNTVGESCCVFPRESFNLEKDSLVIVSKWSVKRVAFLTESSAAIKVDYRVIANTKGFGEPHWFRRSGREIVLSVPGKTETVTYQLRKKDDNWFLVNPPVPRVGRNAILAQLEDTLAWRTKTLSELNPGEETYDMNQKNLHVAIEHFQRQIKALKQITTER